jgi:hypothetical protein
MRTIIELISATSTSTGLSVQADYDPGWYPKGVKITDKENSPRCHSIRTSSTENGTTPSTLNQTRREP